MNIDQGRGSAKMDAASLLPCVYIGRALRGRAKDETLECQTLRTFPVNLVLN